MHNKRGQRETVRYTSPAVLACKTISHYSCVSVLRRRTRVRQQTHTDEKYFAKLVSVVSVVVVVRSAVCGVLARGTVRICRGACALCTVEHS